MKRKHLWRVLCLLVLTSILVGFAPKASASSFTDVSLSNMDRETFDAIMYVSDNGLMVGTSSNCFSPKAVMSRAQIVQILYSLVGSPPVKGRTTFTDVPSTAWYYKAVVWAYSNGIVSGTSNTTFSPNMALTIEQTMCILHRYATSFCSYPDNKSSSINNYSDYKDISSYARAAVQWAVSNGILIPKSNLLYPKKQTLRQEMALYLCRFRKRVEGFTPTEKIFSFSNSGKDFFKEGESRNYALSDALVEQVKKQIKNRFSSETANKYINDFQTRMQNKWGGACNGMSFVTLFDMLGRIDFNKYVGGYANISSVPSPKVKRIIRDSIHYYQVTAGLLAKYRTDYSGPEISAGIGDLYTQVTKYCPTVFSYFWHNEEGNTTGHSIIVTKVTKQRNSYTLTIVDPNKANATSEKVLNFSDGKADFGGKTLTTIGFFTPSNLNDLSFLDLDGPYNNATASRRSVEKPCSPEALKPDDLSGKTYITTLAYPFEIQLENGTRLTFDGDTFSGNAPFDSAKFNTYSDDVAEVILTLPGEHTVKFVNSYDVPCSFFVATDQYTAMVQGDSVSTAEFSVGSVRTNVRSAGEVETILFNEQNEMIKISGSARSVAEVSYQKAALSVRGIVSGGTVKYFASGSTLPFACNGKTVTLPCSIE